MATDTAVLRHPLFDPSSDYCRLLAGGRADYKMLGYLAWMASRADRFQYPPKQSSERSEDERRQLACRLANRKECCTGGQGPDIQVLDALTCPGLILVLGIPEELGQKRVAGAAEFCLVREADQSLSVGMVMRFVEGPRLEGRFRCRAFLLELEVIDRLEGLLGDKSYIEAFTPEALTNILDVARILSVTSDLAGEWTPGESEVCFHRIGIPGGYTLFPPRGRAEPIIVVVALHPADDEPPTAER
jgi:hypothetical protein